MEPKTIALAEPIHHDGKTFAELRIREAELGDLIAMEETRGGDLAQFAVLLSRLAGVPLEVVKKLRSRDLKRIQTEAGALLGNDAGEAGASSPP